MYVYLYILMYSGFRSEDGTRLYKLIHAQSVSDFFSSLPRGAGGISLLKDMMQNNWPFNCISSSFSNKWGFITYYIYQSVYSPIFYFFKNSTWKGRDPLNTPVRVWCLRHTKEKLKLSMYVYVCVQLNYTKYYVPLKTIENYCKKYQ